MNKRMMVAACLLALILLTFGVRIASAHTTVKSGPYAIEIGWVSEPPIIGQMNAIVVNISTTNSSMHHLKGMAQGSQPALFFWE